jgi:alkanesulfonate monooxygenase SsuD/methylene tetrahydromethanopterin reductase-like flavin-dependent oxidoreductase (luciferase family)
LTLHTNHDWSQYDLDAPFPQIDPKSFTQGFQGFVQSLLNISKNGKRTLRETLSEQETTSLKLIGTPEQVADQMEAAMAQIEGDGWLFHARPLTRRYLAEILDGLVPILQKRGLVRTHYTTAMLREHLREF